jgi:hypothetical protein
VKQRLVIETSGRFSEAALGFERFEEFARAVEQRGRIRVRVIDGTAGNREIVPVREP